MRVTFAGVVSFFKSLPADERAAFRAALNILLEGADKGPDKDVEPVKVPVKNKVRKKRRTKAQMAEATVQEILTPMIPITASFVDTKQIEGKWM